LTQLADEALLRAKQTGRNRTCVASTGELTELKLGAGKDKRKSTRIQSNLRVRYLELPELPGRGSQLTAKDISAGGISLAMGSEQLKKNSYALVYLEDDQKPLLSRVVWTQESDSGEKLAGLEFLGSPELHPVHKQPSKAAVLLEKPSLVSVVERVLMAAGYEPKVFGAGGAPLADLNLAELSLVVVGASSLRSELGSRLASARTGRRSSARVIVLNEDQNRRDAIRSITSEEPEHWVTSDDTAGEEALFATLTKLMLGDYFGLKKYLFWGATTKSWSIRNSEEKGKALRGLRAFAKEVRCHPRVVDNLLAAVDEMIINSLYGPADRTRRRNAPVSVECGSDGRLLGVAVLDQHGSFNRGEMFRALGEALKRETGGMGEEAGSAKLGFKTMLGALSQLAINLDPRRCTEVIGLIDLRKSLRDLRKTGPSVGVFTKKDSSASE
jgi:hypothetical protein